MNAGLSALPAPIARLAGDRFSLLAVAVAAIWIALGTNLVGLKVGKWTQNIGGAATWTVTILLIAVAALVWKSRGSATAIDIVPRWSWSTVNFWSNLAYGMSGMEMVALMGAEIRDPLRTLPRAGWIASGFGTLFYISTTVALLVILRPEKISEMTGLTQAGEAAGAALRIVWIAPLLAVLVLANGVGQIGGLGTSVSRLPFAVGVDRMLPAAFARVHSRWGTPYFSILGLGVVATFLLAVYQLGDTLRAAYDELVSLMVITGFLPYLYIFSSAWKAGKRISAVSGLAVTVATLLCAVVPTAEVSSVWLFEGKLAAGTLAVIGAAWLLYRRAIR
jgi:amino acid transporter